MRQMISISVLGLLFASTLSHADEIVLRDGTTIQGKLIGLKADEFEVSTSYGKIKVNRANLGSISFSDEKSGTISATPKNTSKRIQETVDGTHYRNQAANFTLDLPQGWRIAPELRDGSEGISAGFTSADRTRFGVVTMEPFEGSLEAYEELLKINWSQLFQGAWVRLNGRDVTIDGNPGRIILMQAYKQDVPFKFLIGFALDSGRAVRIGAWTVEPLFQKETQDAFEKFILSYQAMK